MGSRCVPIRFGARSCPLKGESAFRSGFAVRKIRRRGMFTRLRAFRASRYPCSMQITNDRLRDFQEAYAADFGDQISIEEAREMLNRLVGLYELLLRPLPTPEDR